MFPHELLGQKALRTKEVMLVAASSSRPATYEWSYNTNPVIIMAATPHHLVVVSQSKYSDKEKKEILDHRFIDDNWVSYDDLMALATPEHIELMLKLTQTNPTDSGKEDTIHDDPNATSGD